MTDLMEFIVSNQEYVLLLLGFFVLIYVARFFYMFTIAIFNIKKAMKIR